MKAPRRLKVGPFRYRLRIGGRGFDRHRAEEGSHDLQGRCENEALLIAVKGGLALGVEREVVLHEVLHTCMYAAGLPLSGDDEETAVRAITTWLLGVLRENPAFVAYLTAPD